MRLVLVCGSTTMSDGWSPFLKLSNLFILYFNVAEWQFNASRQAVQTVVGHGLGE
jgi:hypothetical protein